MNVKNIIGIKTNDYIAMLHDGKLEPKQSKQENKIMSTEKTVIRTIDGKKVNLTPTENFIDRAAYRLLMLKTQFDQLGKQVGPQYEKTDEMIATIETVILEMAENVIAALKQPTTTKAKAAVNPFKKLLKNC
ncbi:hypothetical protein LCGC14_0355860 [marine sediment metagenome]|uniref:Uncharacterized protein n=1 Tax=marine sediment metagenome TaxID=412755 RepID=A0A0F9TF17_9ZZZZ